MMVRIRCSETLAPRIHRVNASLAMAAMKKTPRYKVDQRVSIALDALDEDEQRAIRKILKDRDHFLASAADRRKVRRISKTHPFYALSVPSGLRFIFSKVGDEVVVMDLMHEAVLAGFAPRRGAGGKGSGTRRVRAASRAGKEK
jgi:hypothetical protein